MSPPPSQVSPPQGPSTSLNDDDERLLARMGPIINESIRRAMADRATGESSSATPKSKYRARKNVLHVDPEVTPEERKEYLVSVQNKYTANASSRRNRLVSTMSSRIY
jgi:hypothetical protein